MMPKIVVLGAGVSGLTTALLLAKKGSQNGLNITVVAKHMPGDYDIEYASPWAGADFAPEFGGSADSYGGERFERATWPELSRLARDVPESGIGFRPLLMLRRAKDAKCPAKDWMKDAWFMDEMPEFRFLDPSELPDGVDVGATMTSVTINVPIYLCWLVGQCLRLGVVFKRAVASDLFSAAHFHHSGKRADLVVNCTGLSSRHLGNVEDSNLFPIRGQITVVRNESSVCPSSFSISGTDDGPGEAAYIIPRPAGGGCILGGCKQKNSWESQPDPNLAVRIMKRTIELDPSIVPKGQGIEALSVVRHTVGLRPGREGGPRLERQLLSEGSGKSLQVVHNYGHGGAGYQMSYGTALEAVSLVQYSLLEEVQRSR